MLGLLAAAALLARPLLRRVRAARDLEARARGARPEPPWARLAASQVGYAPPMQKRFTSPRPFQGFDVVRDEDGTVAWHGTGPLCQLPGSEGGPPVWVGDFSALRTAGRYRLEAAGVQSHPFTVGTRVFDGPVRAAQRAFWFQRAFTAVDAAHAEGPWVHPSDADRAPPGVRGGWHDAGDFSLYSASTTSALYWLLEAARDFRPSADDTDIPQSGNGVPDLLDEARWGLEWMLSVQAKEGGFANSTCQQQYGPYGTNTPTSVPVYRAGEVGTLATARAVGTLASASELWQRIDPPFAEVLLQAARAGQRYLDAHPEFSDGPTCPAYRADGDVRMGRQTRMYAAAGMLLATSEPRFARDFERALVPVDADPSYRNLNGFAARLYLRAPGADPVMKRNLLDAFAAQARRSRLAGRADPFGRSAPNFWGSLAAGFVRSGTFNVLPCLASGGSATTDCQQALDNVHHALGRNPLHLVYLSGLEGVTHGRAHAFHHWLATLDARPFLPPGLVAGGPNASPEPMDRSQPGARPLPLWGYWGDPLYPRTAETPYEERYTDNDSWSTNEVSLDWQAATLYALYFAQWVARNPAAEPAVEAHRSNGKLPRCDRLPPSD